MSSLGNHLVRRGLESVTRTIKTGGDNGGGHVSPLQMSLIIGTAFAFAAAIFSIQYTYGMVVATLAIVEDPQPEHYSPINSNDEEGDDVTKAVNNPNADVLIVRPKPITSKLRTTIRHLRARAGRLSPFRGLGLFLIWGFCRAILVSILSFGASGPCIVRSIAQIASELALSTLELAWVHVVISEPSAKPLYKRIPGPRSWVKIAPAVALRATASQVCFLLPAYLGTVLNVFRPDGNGILLLPSHDRSPHAALAALAVIILSVALTFLIEIPAAVTMVRVAASMLPDDDEAIVPFDRTFGGKVEPAVVGGSGKIGLLDAWKTFTWPSRVRLLKVLGKVFGMLIAVVVLFSLIVGAQVAVLPRGALKEIFGDKRGV